MSDWKKWMAESDRYAARLNEMPHRVFPVNPYVNVYTDEDVPGVYHLCFQTRNKGATAWMHLLVGEERALLIDTAFGVGDLLGLVRCLTDKPLDVVNTHFHGDHSAGNGQFERIYLHEYDIPYLRACEERGEAGRMMPDVANLKPEDVVPIRASHIVPLTDGQTLCLGAGREVEVIHMPGHAAGGCMLLDHATNLLFSGDAVVFTPTLIIDRFPAPWTPEMMTVTAFRNALAAAMPRLSHVRKLYTGHSVQGIAPTQLTDMLACCNKVIEHPEEHELYDYVDDPGQKQIMCVGKAMIVYSDSRI